MQRTNLPEWGSRKETTTIDVLFNFFAMEKNMAKNVKRLQSQKDTGSEPTINAEKDKSASNVEAVMQGVKRKLFCSSEHERPEDASPFKNTDTREKQCRPDEDQQEVGCFHSLKLAWPCLKMPWLTDLN